MGVTTLTINYDPPVLAPGGTHEIQVAATGVDKFSHISRMIVSALADTIRINAYIDPGVDEVVHIHSYNNGVANNDCVPLTITIFIED